MNMMTKQAKMARKFKQQKNVVGVAAEVKGFKSTGF